MAYYIYLIILKFNLLFNLFINKVLNIRVIIIYIKNLFFYNKVIRYIDYKTIT